MHSGTRDRKTAVYSDGRVAVVDTVLRFTLCKSMCFILLNRKYLCINLQESQRLLSSDSRVAA